jgi:hypothetical protein
MTVLRNGAFWVLMSAIGLFWFSDMVLGTDLNRDVVDLVSIVFCTAMAIRLLPDAIDRFQRGASQKNWQLLISNMLFFSGWAVFSVWAFLYRGLEKPEWMAISPLNGFFRFWILGAAVLAFFSTTEMPTPMPATRVYYIGIGVALGVLIGVAGSQLAGNLMA